MRNSLFFFGRLAKAIWFMHIPGFILVNRFYFIFWGDPNFLNSHCFFDAYSVSWNSPSCLHIVKEFGGLSLGSCPQVFSEKLSRELKNHFSVPLRESSTEASCKSWHPRQGGYAKEKAMVLVRQAHSAVERAASSHMEWSSFLVEAELWLQRKNQKVQSGK